MTSRGRLTALFNGDPIDRVPIWLLNPVHPIKWYPDIYSLDSYRLLVEYIELYCDNLDRRYYDRGFCYSHNSDIERISKRGSGSTSTTQLEIVRYKDIELKKSIGTDDRGRTQLRYFVETIEDLDKVLSMPYSPPKFDLSSYWIEKEQLADRGLMMLDLGDPLEVLYHLMSAENFSIFSLTEYDKIIEFTDVMYDRVFEFYDYFLQRDIGEVFFIVGAEFAGPPLVAPQKFVQLSVRYVKGLVDLIRSYGKWSIVHYHGNLFEVLDGMKLIGMDGLHTIESPPTGDCTITQAREALGERTILIGNVQYDDLKHGRQEEIIEMVVAILEEAKSGRFILSPTAGPYEENIDETTLENYMALIDAGIAYGKL
jgi:uroporphyrinogen-III decarboxylase